MKKTLFTVGMEFILAFTFVNVEHPPMVLSDVLTPPSNLLMNDIFRQASFHCRLQRDMDAELWQKAKVSKSKHKMDLRKFKRPFCSSHI